MYIIKTSTGHEIEGWNFSFTEIPGYMTFDTGIICRSFIKLEDLAGFWEQDAPYPACADADIYRGDNAVAYAGDDTYAPAVAPVNDGYPDHVYRERTVNTVHGTPVNDNPIGYSYDDAPASIHFDQDKFNNLPVAPACKPACVPFPSPSGKYFDALVNELKFNGHHEMAMKVRSIADERVELSGPVNGQTESQLTGEQKLSYFEKVTEQDITDQIHPDEVLERWYALPNSVLAGVH